MGLTFMNKLLSTNATVLVSLRNNHKLICKIVKYDKHFNLIVRDIEIYKNMKNKNKGIKKKEVGYSVIEDYKENEVYIRGDNVIYISEMEG